MSYSTFNIKKVKEELNITIVEEDSIFSLIQQVDISDILAQILEEHVPLALAINTEKARSELIVSNILVELRRMFNRKISIFSGIEFDVDKNLELKGFCDFIVSRSPEQLSLEAPVVMIVEAKNENLIAGIGQCIAEMLGARIFNEREKNTVQMIYGAVTSGNAWKFLKLDQNTVYADLKEFYIENPGKILGILSAMVKQTA